MEEQLNLQEIEYICHLIVNRNIFATQRQKIRKHIGYSWRVWKKANSGLTMKRGQFKNKNYKEIRLYILKQEKKMAKLCAKRSKYAKQTTNKFKKLLKKNKAILRYNADNHIVEVVFDNLNFVIGQLLYSVAPKQTLIQEPYPTRNLSLERINKLAQDYIFHKAIFGEGDKQTNETDIS